MIDNKKAWIRIVEAFIAILLVAGVLAFVFVKQIQKPAKEEAIIQIQRIILDEIADDKDLRTAVLAEDKSTIKNHITNRIPADLDFDICISDVGDNCNPLEVEIYTKKDIYVDEIIISSTLTEYNPRKLRLFIWEK